MKKILCALLLVLSGCVGEGVYYYEPCGYWEDGIYYPYHYHYYSTYRPYPMQWGVRCSHCHLPMYRCHCHH